MCESCAQLADQNHALQERAVSDFDKIGALVNRLTKADQENAGLRGQLTQLRTDSPKMADAREVFDFWCRRLKKRSNTTFGPKRQEKVIARLKEKPSTPGGNRKDDLKWAIRGCEALPCVGPKGRQARGGKRHDRLGLICQDEETVERFMEYADDQADGMFRTFVTSLIAAVGEQQADVIREGGQPIMVCSRCPVCEEDWALTAFPGRAPFGELLVVKCRGNSCSSASVLSGLRALAEEKAA